VGVPWAPAAGHGMAQLLAAGGGAHRAMIFLRFGGGVPQQHGRHRVGLG